uniref:Uncharacterized protein n=1 Tax=Rhizophora mucronata TaxID=61149 RepID=A0A2P2NAV8_RHIMU
MLRLVMDFICEKSESQP